eukprot:scaffold40033_cov37-Tisochrysis_lutea.AAC.1
MPPVSTRVPGGGGGGGRVWPESGSDGIEIEPYDAYSAMTAIVGASIASPPKNSRGIVHVSLRSFLPSRRFHSFSLLKLSDGWSPLLRLSGGAYDGSELSVSEHGIVSCGVGGLLGALQKLGGCTTPSKRNEPERSAVRSSSPSSRKRSIRLVTRRPKPSDEALIASSSLTACIASAYVAVSQRPARVEEGRDARPTESMRSSLGDAKGWSNSGCALSLGNVLPLIGFISHGLPCCCILLSLPPPSLSHSPLPSVSLSRAPAVALAVALSVPIAVALTLAVAVLVALTHALALALDLALALALF